MRTRAQAMSFGLALLWAPAMPVAYAQPAPSIEQAKAEARAAADEGLAHYNAGRYKEALAAFRRADERFHAPTIVLMIARAHAKLGRLRDARAYYLRVIDEELAHYAPPPFFEAQASARKELNELTARIPTLRVTVTGAQSDTVVLTIDGRRSVLGQPLPLDPGEHAVVAGAPHRELVTKRVVLREGDDVALTLELSEPDPDGGSASDAPSRPAGRGYVGPAIAAFGAAGLALGVGALTGAMTFGRVGSLEDECPDRTCYDDAGGDGYDSARALGTVSTVSFVIGAVAAGAGVALLFWPRGEGEAAQIGMRFGPGWAGVAGAF